MMITWMSFVCLFFGFQYIGDITYAAVTKKHISPYNFKDFIDLFIFLIFFINILITFSRNLKDTISEGLNVVTWDEKAVIYCLNYASTYAEETNLLILGVVMLWVRVINFVRYNEALGKFISVVERLITEISLFFALYVINLIVFATVAEAAFRELKQYNNI